MMHENFIDERSASLWNLLSAEYNISTRDSFEPNYLLQMKGKEVVIYIPSEKPSKEGFIHELLHVYVHRQKAIIGGLISLSFKSNPILKNYFLPELSESISNNLDHPKMLPIYLRMGFVKELFIHDYNTPKFDDQLLKALNEFFQVPSYRKISVDVYVGKYFAMKACPNDTFDYNKYLHGLQFLDNDLFFILETLWNKWECVDIENSKETLSQSIILSGDFVDTLTDWVLSNG